MSRRERSLARAICRSLLTTLFLLPAVSQAGVTATGILDFSWTTTGVSSVSDPNVGGYGIFQFDDADPWNLQVRESYDPTWQPWGGAAMSFGTTSLASSIASQISANSTTTYPLAAGGQMTATATAIKPDDQTYERAVSSVSLGFVRVVPDLSLTASDTAQTATLDLTFSQSSSFTANPLVTDVSAFSDMFFSVAMRVGWYDDEDNLWQAYSFYSENPSVSGLYGATWDINPYSEQMFFFDHPISASMYAAGTGVYVPVPEFKWADYQAVLGKFDLIDDYTGFEMSFSVTGYAAEYGSTAASLPIEKYWIGGNGSWNDGNNWNPSGEPATGDAIHLETSDDATRVVTYDTTRTDPTFSSLRIDATSGGSITLQQSQNSLSVDGGYTEIGWAGKGTFEQDGGASSFDTVIVGSKAGSDGSVILSGGTTTIKRLVVAEQAGSSGNVKVHTDGYLSVATDAVIGEGGSGTFVQDGGTSAITTMIVGAKSGGTGSVTLSGGTTAVDRLVVAENTGSSGSVAVSGTGALTVNTDVVIGQGGNGSFSLSGRSLTVDGWGTIGVSNSGSFSQTDGTSAFLRVVLGLTSTGIGSFDLTGGTSTIGELVLGHDAGSQGTFNLSGTGNLIVTSDATIGSGSVGVFNQSGGTADVGNYLFVGRAPTGVGTINLSGGLLSANQLTVGHDSGAQGDVNLSGNGTLSLVDATLGLNGSGDLNQTGGTLEIANNLHLGQAEGGWGTYTLVAGESNIGGSAYIGEGKNSVGVFLQAGGTAMVTADVIVGGKSGSGGFLIQDGGLLQVGNVVAVGTDSGRGTYVLADVDAKVTAREVRVGSNGTLLGIGTIVADVVNEGGFIGPGLSPGKLDIVGDFLFKSGVLEIEVEGLGADQFDVLNISGEAKFLGGTILFSFIDGFLPKQGDIIPFLLAGSVTGLDLVTFDYIGAAPGFDFNISYDEATNKVVFEALNNAQAVPEPATLALIALGLAGLGAVRRRKLAA